MQKETLRKMMEGRMARAKTVVTINHKLISTRTSNRMCGLVNEREKGEGA
jgi:hypothetical protein